MAKVGYIFLAEAYESVESDKAWMEKFGCVKIVEENAEDEKLRPEWKASPFTTRLTQRMKSSQL